MKRLVLILLIACLLCLPATAFAKETTVSFSIPAKVTFIDGATSNTVEAELNETLQMPQVNTPENMVFVGFYYTYNNMQVKWNFASDVVTKDKLEDGLNLTLRAKYQVSLPNAEPKQETKIVIEEEKNFLDCKLELDKDALSLNEDEQGKKVKINLVLNESFSKGTDEKAEIDKICEESNQEVLTYFELILEKTVSFKTTNVTELESAAKLTITVPDDIYDESFEYSIYRAHTNEDKSIVVDKIFTGFANSDKKITFYSDKFSTYALTYKNIEVVEETEIIFNDVENYLDAKFEFSEDAINILDEEKGKEINISLIVKELANLDSNEKKELDKKCEEEKKEILTSFEIF